MIQFSTLRQTSTILFLLAMVASWFVTENNFDTALFAQDFASDKHANWHQWRGPEASGIASQGNPPTSWDDNTNIKWKFEIEGEGSSTPIIWDNQVFILSAIITDRKPEVPPKLNLKDKTKPPPTIVEFMVWSLNRATGEVQWKKKVTEAAPCEGRHPSTTYAAASPVTNGNHLFVSFGSYGIFCLTMDGEIVWEKDLGDMRTRKGWGEAVSPVLHEGHLVVNWDQEEQSRIFILNSETGDVVWTKERDEPTTWATPLVTKVDGVNQVVTNGTTAIRSYNLETGDIVWQSPGTTLNAIPCPVLDGDNVICMGGYRGHAAMSIDLHSKGIVPAQADAVDSPIHWTVAKHTPYVPSPLVMGDRLYFTKSLQGILNCLDVKTGKPLYELTRMPNMKSMYGSPVAINDRIYFTSREGTTLVIRDSEKFEVISTNQLAEEIDASPAIAGDQLFLRGKKNLYCIEAAK